MIILVIGGSGSGKSAYAESLLEEFQDKYYIATMEALDEEARRRVERHRQLRGGKGFVTIEQPRELIEAAEKIRRNRIEAKHHPKRDPKRPVAALLECVSNLVANEMFLPAGIRGEQETSRQVIRGVETLAGEVEELVVVSNNVFEDGICYDESTMAYLRSIAKVNEALAELADRVVEVVVGIPVTLKE